MLIFNRLLSNLASVEIKAGRGMFVRFHQLNGEQLEVKFMPLADGAIDSFAASLRTHAIQTFKV